ncbi:MAG: hypothetical protein V3V57_05065 [Spirochaetia bacterium]
MADLISMLREQGIDEDFETLGLHFNSLFPTDRIAEKGNPYQSYEWLAKTVPRFGTVINAVPPEEQMKELPWEEWYTLEGVNHHHVLYLKEPATYDELFEAPDADEVHPPRTLGRNWYVIDDPDMSPVLLR